MIQRYLDPGVEQIWSDAHRYDLWRRIETAVVEAYEAEGRFPASVLDEVRGVTTPSVASVAEAEGRTKHDVGAFLLCWTEGMTADAASRVHRGLTSSDLVDTALAMQVQSTSTLVLDEMTSLRDVLRDHALLHLTTERVGRTHGQFAAQDSWGHRVADFAFAVDRVRTRFLLASTQAAVGKLSGPVGNNEQVPMNVETFALALLGLERASTATQVLCRDRLAAWVFELSLAVTVCEAVALELRLSQLSDVSETREAVVPGQIGSSSMPHKRNPITAEQICGLARVVRGYVVPVMEGIPLWFQRDISHSSVERICLPDASALTVHVLRATRVLISNLEVDSERMSRNLAKAGGVVRSHADVTALMDSGLPYIQAHRQVAEQTALSTAPDFPSTDRPVLSLGETDTLRRALQDLTS